MAHLFNAKQTDSLYLLFRSIKGHPMHSLPKGTSTNFKTLESAALQNPILKTIPSKYPPLKDHQFGKLCLHFAGHLTKLPPTKIEREFISK